MRVILFVLVLGLLGSVTSCDRPDLEGPELVDIFGEFEVLHSLSQNTVAVDFSAGETVDFTALLSIRTNWELTITGLESGGIKIIEGNEKNIMGDVARWNGSVSFAPLFSQNEKCVAVMTFNDYSDTLTSDTITILGTKPLPTGGLLVSDFEDDTQAVEGFSEFQFEETYLGFADFIPAAIGDQFYYLEGQDNNGSVFVCGLGITAEVSQGTTYYEFTKENPDKVFFNCFIYGAGYPNTEMTIEFQEDDNLDGIYVPSQEGTYRIPMVVDWEGWKLISFPLSETELSPNGGFGNIDATGQKDIDRIINIQFVLLSTGGQNDNPVAFGVDHAIFTENFPFEP